MTQCADCVDKPEVLTWQAGKQDELSECAAGTKRTALLPLLPLSLQMMRFYYKADVQQKAKILRKVRVWVPVTG